MSVTSSAPQTTSDTALHAFESVISNRRSVRAFLPASVPKAQIERLLMLAGRAPSNCNTQPWIVHLASGQSMQKLRTSIPAAVKNGDFSLDFPYDGKYSGVYKERQHSAANCLFSAMHIEREEKEKRAEAFMQNFSFFGAPHTALLFMEEGFGLREAADVGMFAQSFMLACTALGLASCPQTSIGLHADTVRKELGINDKFKLLFGIAFGYEDRCAAANHCRTARAPLAESIVFHD